MTSIRHDGDTWDLASSVGSTATAAAPYLIDLGWTLYRTSVRDLLAADDLAPLDNDDLRMGAMHYISGELDNLTE